MIRLRRPATLSLLDEPFVPAADPARLADVERRWEALRAANPAYFDGRVCHVLGVHRNGCGGAVLHVADCAYRFHAVQDDGFDLGVRPLGVKGITERGGRVLVGRRSPDVGGYPGRWEFAPGGVVEPGDTPEETVRRELVEETGLDLAAPPIAIALLRDDVQRCWEIVYRLTAAPGRLRAAEYDALEFRDRDDLPDPLTPVARRMVAFT